MPWPKGKPNPGQAKRLADRHRNPAWRSTWEAAQPRIAECPRRLLGTIGKRLYDKLRREGLDRDEAIREAMNP